MSRYRKKGPREKDLTSRYLSGGLEQDRVDQTQRFSAKNKNLQQNKILRTALMRAEEEAASGDIDSLAVGEVIQVHSMFSDNRHDGVTHICVIPKTLTKISDTYVVVGDRVRFRDVTTRDEAGKEGGGRDPDLPPEGVIEQIL